ncbi:hypothetical protein E2C01_078892 [Portunus trituberculatus]|uniref:Uncharacterized protein n=1 Tax=Portunus trituberculatus TaxID=210409 RepID=A0A5B7IVC8_PORTR|nr:hypothetical protein [Portunus trituberculatus]
MESAGGGKGAGASMGVVWAVRGELAGEHDGGDSTGELEGLLQESPGERGERQYSSGTVCMGDGGGEGRLVRLASQQRRL